MDSSQDDMMQVSPKEETKGKGQFQQIKRELFIVELRSLVLCSTPNPSPRHVSSDVVETLTEYLSRWRDEVNEDEHGEKSART